MSEAQRSQVGNPGSLIQLAESEQLDWRSPGVTDLFTKRMAAWRQSEGLERHQVENGLEFGGMFFEVETHIELDQDLTGVAS